jgi:hypothetical protein
MADIAMDDAKPTDISESTKPAQENGKDISVAKLPSDDNEKSRAREQCTYHLLHSWHFLKLICGQVEFYFHDSNLPYDRLVFSIFFLRACIIMCLHENKFIIFWTSWLFNFTCLCQIDRQTTKMNILIKILFAQSTFPLSHPYILLILECLFVIFVLCCWISCVILISSLIRFMWQLHTANPEHWIPISTIASFKRMREFASHGHDWLVDALRTSSVLEIDESGNKCRRIHEVKERNAFDCSVYAVSNLAQLLHSLY